MDTARNPLIGTRVKAARERLSWSREELAFHSTISWTAIAQIESGRRTNLRPTTLSALADALGVTIDYLVRGGGAAHPLFRHEALLYDSEEEFLATAGPFLSQGLERSEAVLAVTTSANISLLRERLGSDAGRVEFAESRSWYESPASALGRYREFASAKLEAGISWVRIVGEPVWESRSASQVRLGTRYESLLNLVFASWPVTLVCPYDQRTVQPRITKQAHLTHPHTIASTGVATSPDYADPAGFVLE